MGDFAIQLNKNSFGLSPDSPLSVPTLAPDASHDTALPLNHLGAIQRMDPLGKLQIAIKNSVDVLYFSTEVPFHVLFSEDGSLARGEYLQMWKEMDDNEEAISSISGVASNTEGILNRLEANNVFLIAKRKVEGKVGRPCSTCGRKRTGSHSPAFTLVCVSHPQELCYMSLKFINNVTVLMELALEPGSPTAKVRVGCDNTTVSSPHAPPLALVLLRFLVFLTPPLSLSQLSIRTRIQEVVDGVQESVSAMLQTALASEA
jgi:AP-1 complex subunit beta-1